MSNIHGLNSFNNKDNDNDDEEEYYAGGVNNRGGGSGVAVTGPDGRRGDEDGNVFSRIVKTARDHTKETPDSDNISTKFKITLYKNGFTIDDGPLRSADDEAGKLFLKNIADGYVPQELMDTTMKNQRSGSNASSAAMSHPPKVSIALEDKRSESYVQPSYVKFGGVGNALGASAQDTATTCIADPSDTSLPPPPVIDSTKPITTIQVRLLNGKKIRIQINTTATVAQMLSMIQSQQGSTAGGAAAGGGQRFIVSSGYPPSDLDLTAMHTQTVTEANLLNAAVTLKPAP